MKIVDGTSTIDPEIESLATTTGASWWCFDTGSNVHLTGSKSLFVHVEDIDQESLGARVHAVGTSMLSKASGIGTDIELFVDNVLRRFEVDWNRGTEEFSLFMDDQLVMVVEAEQNIWLFKVYDGPRGQSANKQQRLIANYAVTDGVESLQVWHERLAHTNPQYLKLMVDQAKKRQKNLYRQVTAPREIVFANLMLPGQNMGTRYSAVLVIMDGWSRYLTIHLLTNKSSLAVNSLMQ
ncbi:TPA: hypothetical protein N0F65_002624, partial [Lagenidium giganteum]